MEKKCVRLNYEPEDSTNVFVYVYICIRCFYILLSDLSSMFYKF
jgi:hypothetical protein